MITFVFKRTRGSGVSSTLYLRFVNVELFYLSILYNASTKLRRSKKDKLLIFCPICGQILNNQFLKVICEGFVKMEEFKVKIKSENK